MISTAMLVVALVFAILAALPFEWPRLNLLAVSFVFFLLSLLAPLFR